MPMSNVPLILSNAEAMMPRRSSPPLPTWEHTLAFQLIDPERNRYRSYHLQLNRDLFGGWVVIRHWGRIGTPGHLRVGAFPTAAAAMTRANRLCRRRLLYEYHLMVAQ